MVFNFTLNDRRKGPFWNVIMWTSLFLGQGVIICLYSQEWYARQYCPMENVSAWPFPWDKQLWEWLSCLAVQEEWKLNGVSLSGSVLHPCLRS